jgi:hypothetical protein
MILFLHVCLKGGGEDFDKYKISCILKDDKIIKVTIKKDKNTLVICVSYCVLPEKLSKLGESFGVDSLKSIFPYKFAIRSNLLYRGVTPDFHYYENISLKEYKEIFKQD